MNPLKPLFFGTFASLLAISPLAYGANVTLKVIDQAPPAVINASIRKDLAPKAVELLDGDTPIYQFWFRKTLPLKAKPDSPSGALGQIKETTLIGAAVVGKNRRDYRDDAIRSGVYTMLLGLQPQDGDHMGTADYPYFAVLVPAKSDEDLSAITSFKTMVKASGKNRPSEHPIVISLRPLSSDSGNFPRLYQPLPDHKSVCLKLPAQAPGSGQSFDICFQLVYQGHGMLQ